MNTNGQLGAPKVAMAVALGKQHVLSFLAAFYFAFFPGSRADISWFGIIWADHVHDFFFDLNIVKIFQDEIWSGSKEASQQLARPGNGSTFSYDIDNFREKSFEVPLQQVLRRIREAVETKKGS